jgi:hypothetical protein
MVLRISSTLLLLASVVFGDGKLLAGYDKLCPIDLGFGDGPKEAKIRQFHQRALDTATSCLSLHQRFQQRGRAQHHGANRHRRRVHIII